MKFHTVQELSLKGKKALIRVDFNVPLNEYGEITDDSRIQQALATVRFVLAQGGSVVLMSHLGRPNGNRVEELSLAPIAKRLSEKKFLNLPVALAPDCIGEQTEKMVSRLGEGQVLLLENLRFHPGEEDPKSEPDFVDKLAKLDVDLYINDAFASAHRKHASTYYIAEKIPNHSAGFLIEKEVLILSNLLTQAKSPFYAIIGGSKISTKIGLLKALCEKVDALFIGGGMVFTFLKAMGIEIGNSLIDESHIDTAKQLLKKRGKDFEIHLPVDIVITESLSSNAETRIIDVKEGIPPGWIGADIGPETIRQWGKSLSKAQTIFWNGPLGVFELEPFKAGTQAIAKMIASSSAMSIIGGGDSAAAIHQMGIAQKFTCISTGGGATLEFIEFGTLPALEVLT